jgi:outer membrane protein with beta-barrel domain
MKRLLITALACAAAGTVFAQDTKTDTVKSGQDTIITKHYNDDEDDYEFWHRHHHRNDTYPKGFIGITFSRFDLGLATLVDHGSFTLSPQNQFLDYRSWKTSNVGFDVFQMGVKVNKNFKVYLSGGFDWTLIRLQKDITILPSQPVLTYRVDSIHYSKNRFSSSYLRIPLSFDFHTDADRHGNKFHFVFGPEAGLLLDGMVKQISEENGKQKIDNGYHFAKVRYGGFLRIGYAGWGVFAKYYANDMFESSPAQADLKNFSFGLTFGF